MVSLSTLLRGAGLRAEGQWRLSIRLMSPVLHVPVYDKCW